MPNSTSSNYIISLKPYAILSAGLFALSLINGYLITALDPDGAIEIMRNLQETYGSLSETEGLELMFRIFINNAVKSFLAAYAAIITLGIAPFVFLWVNGVIAGVVAAILYFDGQFATFLIGITPHGILEIPALILSSALGFRFAKAVFTKISRKKIILSTELKNGSLFFLKVIIPLLIGAAIIETFITPYLLNMRS